MTIEHSVSIYNTVFMHRSKVLKMYNSYFVILELWLYKSGTFIVHFTFYFQIMKEANVKNIVFSSSATVYGSPLYLPLDEKHPTGQGISNPYGKTKFMCEEVMKDLTAVDKVLKCIYIYI